MLAALLANIPHGSMPKRRRRTRRNRRVEENLFGATPPASQGGAVSEAAFIDGVSDRVAGEIQFDALTLIEHARALGMEQEMARAILDDDEAMILILLAAEA